MSSAIFIAASLFGLFGESEPSVPLTVSLANRECAGALNIRSAAPLPYAGKETEFGINLDPAASCVQTPAGPALYRMLQLPQDGTGYVITVKSKPFGAAILPPRILLLDHGGAVRRTLAGDDLMFHGDGLTARFRSHPDESYLVVASDSEKVGGSVSRVAESTSSYIVPAGTGYFNLHTGSDQTTQLVYSYTGIVELDLEPLPKPK